MSKRSGTRPAATPRAKASTGKRHGATNGSGGESTKQVGARALTGRPRVAAPKHANGATRAPARSSSSYAARLPTFDYAATLRRVPWAAWICALVACLNAICWSVVMPAFQAPDEPDHFAYVKQLVDKGSRPTGGGEALSPEENTALTELLYFNVRQQPQNHAIFSQAQQTELQSILHASIGESKGSAAAGVATAQPPLYYALEAIPYAIAQHRSVLDRLQLMRLLSALMAAFTGLFAYLFVRETLPGEPWAWAVGGMAVALAPLLGFISGSVNPDSLLFAISTATFYCLARGFRRGLTTRTSIAIGILIAIGLLTKLNFVGLVPGILLGVLVLTAREIRLSGRSALRLLAIPVAIGFATLGAYAALNLLGGRAALGVLPGTVRASGHSLFARLEYVWQFYLPRLPGMVSDFPGIFTTRQLWFNGYIGLYGWLDTTFPNWVYDAALIPAIAIAILGARALITARSVLRSRLAELAVYAVMSLGVIAMVGLASYGGFPHADAEFAEARYLLPMAALLAAMLALAARGAGRRWGPVVGTVIVVLFLAHDIFSQMLVIGRYYG